MILQLPFFIAALKMITISSSSTLPMSDATNEGGKETPQHYPSWFRSVCVIYGSHVATTLVPIISTFAMSREMSTQQKCATITIYSPYLIFPLWVMWLAIREDFVGEEKMEAELKRE